MHLGDTIFIFCLALIIFGPKKLPEIGRQIGKLMVEFRRASNDFKMQIEEELRASEDADRQKEITVAATSSATASATPVAASTVLAAAAAPNASEGPSWKPYPAAAETPGETPTISPPSTGVPVSHSYSEYSEPAAETDSVPVEAAAYADAYPEPAQGFNAGLNTASNGTIAEASPAETLLPVSAAEAARTEMQEPEADSAQAATHHG